jgi:hypothetical protein
MMDINLNNAAPAGFGALKNFSVPDMVSWSINMLLAGAGIGAFMFLLWGSVEYILSGGEKEGMDKAKKKITGAMIGLSLVFSAYAIAYIPRLVFDVDIFKVCIPGINRLNCSGGSGSSSTMPAGWKCNDNCAPASDGSEKWCYNEEISGNPGKFQEVYCSYPRGFRTKPI